MAVNVSELLQPIPGAKPSGADLRYEPVYDKIKDARTEEEEAPQGQWARARKTADWAQVVKLTTEALTRRTKDVNLAVWLTEAQLRREGFAGLRNGLELLRGLIENFWDTLYPEIEDGDAELRAAPLNWLGTRLDIAVKQIPLTRRGYDFLKYNEAQQMGHEADLGGDYNKLEARKEAIERGMLTAEDWDKGFEETPKAFYKALVADIDGSVELIAALDEFGDKFGEASPSYSRLRQALEEVGYLAKLLLKNKLAVDPDPVEEAPPAGDAAGSFDIDVVSTGGAAAAVARAPISAEPANRTDAVERIVAAARWLRRTEPTNPASYLMLRGLRWGEVRASASGRPDPRLLDAPGTALRTQLKTMLLDGNWAGLLEAGENAMGQACGRGWLDLQRYSITACSRLGREYYAVEMALRDALQAYLADVPEILEVTMMDDTAAANEETRRWIAEKIGVRADGAAPAVLEADSEAADVIEAQELARAGRLPEAVAAITRQLEHERSARGRFRRRTQLASILVDAKQDAIALPILRELVAQIDNYKLEEWESGDVAAEPLALLYGCLHRAEAEAATREELYLRICRLDPLRAMSCPQ
jgi:type VI secretion system protein ImpA